MSTRTSAEVNRNKWKINYLVYPQGPPLVNKKTKFKFISLVC